MLMRSQAGRVASAALVLFLGCASVSRAQDTLREQHPLPAQHPLPVQDTLRAQDTRSAAGALAGASPGDAFVEYPPGYMSPFTVDSGLSLRKCIAGGIVGGLFVGSMIDSYYAWWQVRQNTFHFHEDGWFGENGIGIDKLGHFFTTYFYYRTCYDILRWGGFDHDLSCRTSAGVAFTFALLIEIGDGTTATYGFDYQDLVYNTGGLLYALLQQRCPFLNNFRVTWSYVPYDSYQPRFRFSEHYDAHTYWLAVNVNNLLPAALEPWWPDWLQPALGYSVRDHFTPWHRAMGTAEFVVGLEIDLGAWPIRQRELNCVQRIVRHYHFPMPAVKFASDRGPDWRVFYQQ
jgi:hypothetical protein